MNDNSAKLFCIFLMSAVQTFLATAAWADRNRAYGYEPIPLETFGSLPKERRYRAYLPPFVDLSHHFPEPDDQGSLNSCVGWAVGYAARSYYSGVVEGRDLDSKLNIPSPSYIYHSIRNPKDCSGGSTFPAALEFLKKGSLSWAEYPYSDSCSLVDSKTAAKRKDFRILGWSAVDTGTVDDVKGKLAQGHPVIFGMLVGREFENLQGSTVYAGLDSDDGGHAMTVVGYDDRRQAFKVINSWGRSWGDEGFGWISYDAFRAKAREAYVLRVRGSLPSPKPRPVEVKPVVPTTPPELEPEPKPQPRPQPEPLPTPKPIVTPPEQNPVIEQPVVASDCSRVVATRNGITTRISGFVGTQTDLVQLRRDYSGQTYTIDVEVRPWPQCEVLLTLEGAIQANDRPVIGTTGGVLSFKAQESIVFHVVAPRTPSFLYVSYIQADGSVINLQQPALPALAPSISAKTYVHGDGLEGRAKFRASAPYGSEMVVVLASVSPLFNTPLPAHQTEREYLTAIRKALIYKADPVLPDRIVSATFLGLETKDKE